MSKIISLFKLELKLLLADKRALFLLFLMPVLLITCLSIALTDIYNQKVGHGLDVTLLVNKSYMSDALIEKFNSKDLNYNVIYKVESFDKFVSLNKNKMKAIILIPPDLNKLIQGKVNGNKIKLYFDPTLDFSYKELIKNHLFMSIQDLVIDQVNQQLQNTEELTDVKKIIVNDNLFEEVKPYKSIPNPIQQTIPAWSLFAMFFIALPMSASFIRDRKEGIFTRLLGYNVSKLQIMLGKLSAFFTINVIQFFLMLLFGLLVMPKLTGLEFTFNFSFLSLFLTVLACAFTATSYGLLVSSVFKTMEQAASFGAIAVVLMALFGGVMIPHFAMPETMQNLSIFSPLYWGLESFLDVFLRGSTIFYILPNLIVLLVISFLFFVIALVKFKWRES